MTKIIIQPCFSTEKDPTVRTIVNYSIVVSLYEEYNILKNLGYNHTFIPFFFYSVSQTQTIISYPIVIQNFGIIRKQYRKQTLWKGVHWQVMENYSLGIFLNSKPFPYGIDLFKLNSWCINLIINFLDQYFHVFRKSNLKHLDVDIKIILISPWCRYKKKYYTNIILIYTEYPKKEVYCAKLL